MTYASPKAGLMFLCGFSMHVAAVETHMERCTVAHTMVQSRCERDMCTGQILQPGKAAHKGLSSFDWDMSQMYTLNEDAM